LGILPEKMKIIVILTLSILLSSYSFARIDAVNAEENEVGTVDYEALAHRSEELDPVKNPDEVIALLEPHKHGNDNKRFIFYNNLGLAYKSKGRFKEAISAYVRSLKLEPDEPGALYNLGIAYCKNNELSKALKYFLKSAEQRPDHSGTKKWIDFLAKELEVYKVPDTSKLKLVFDKNINVNKKKQDKESRLRMYITPDGGRIQVLSVDDKVYSYGIDSNSIKPVDYIIIDSDGDGVFEEIINAKGIFKIPTWAYNPE
jgi:tetratricopeptide (TPR) repeat protein